MLIDKPAQVTMEQESHPEEILQYGVFTSQNVLLVRTPTECKVIAIVSHPCLVPYSSLVRAMFLSKGKGSNS